MSQRQSLKIKVSAPPVTKAEPQFSPPLATPSSGTKIKLKFKKTASQAPPPQDASSASAAANPSTAKPKPARKPKPTPKKRALEEDPDLSSDEDHVPPASGPPPKKIKFITRTPSTPEGTGPKIVRLKAKGKVPKRPLGVGYDSEASDRERDPTISESIILRMAPGPDCEYLRAAITAGNFGKIKDGGADVRLRFLRTDGRRAVVTIRGNHYVAILVDLPCVIEAMKSWFPKNGWMKSADICQMLMVLGPIKDESDALEYPLPLQNRGELDEKTWQWAHGLTPPMQWVRKRRFRKRISFRTVMEVETEVEALLRMDEECEGEPRIKIIDHNVDHASEDASDDMSGGEEDAEGDIDDHAETPLETIEGEVEAEAEDEEAENARMAELFERQMMDAATAESNSPPVASAAPSFESHTPAVETSSAAEDEEEDESSDEEAEADEDQLERQQEVQKLKEDIADLEAAIAGEQAKLKGTQNALLRKRLADKISGLQGDLELKVKAVGGGGEG